jgi:spermidine synthase
MRRFAAFLGATAPATAAALAAFFVGFGLGSYLLGRLALRLVRPLRAFAILEIITGVSSLAVDPLLRVTPAVLASLDDTPGDAAATQLAIKVGIAIVAVLVPATAIGGTLPVLAPLVTTRAEWLGIRVGGLYAVNTFGACAGALAVPAILLPALGATGALGAAIVINVCIAAGALYLDRASGLVVTDAASARPARRLLRHTSHHGTLALAAASGAITLALEALASRAFALVHENSVYSFATVVAVFLAGLATGAALGRRALQRHVGPRALATVGWSGAGIWMVLLPALFVRATGLDYLTGHGIFTHEAQLALLAATALLPASVCLGVVLPALIQERGEVERAYGMAVGGILAANTAGAIAGPFVALFVLAPAAGLWNAVAMLGAFSILSAVIAARGEARNIHRTVIAAGALATVVFLATSPWLLPRMKLVGRDRLLHLSEGAFGSVAVVEHDGYRRIKLNNYYVLGGTHAAGDERLQGHIPLLLHPHPERVAFLGLGTAISFSAIKFHPIREALALELVPEVADAARDWFGDANLNVLADPRVKLRAEDARSFLAFTRQRWDVVVGDLVVPWRPGESSLYTRDSFAAVRRVLAPGGLYCQWVPLYQITEAEFDSIAASFLDVFPQTTLWRGDFSAGEAVVGLIGYADVNSLDSTRVDARTRDLTANPDRTNPYLSHPAGLWLYFVGPLDPADPRFRLAPRNRDSNPWVELASAQLHLRIQSGQSKGFVGRPLKARLDAIRRTPLGGTVAASVQAPHLQWRERGAEIWEASLLSFEGDNRAADRLAFGAIAQLPAEIQAAVLGAAAR